MRCESTAADEDEQKQRNAHRIRQPTIEAVAGALRKAMPNGMQRGWLVDCYDNRREEMITILILDASGESRRPAWCPAD